MPSRVYGQAQSPGGDLGKPDTSESGYATDNYKLLT